TSPLWTKEIFSDQHSSINAGNSGIFYWGVNVKKANGTSIWSPIFDNSHEPRLRSAFETAGGTIFIGTDEGIFKTDNSGETWKLVYAGGFVGHLAEANGVLLAIGMKRIIRSTDNGENWSRVISEDSVAFDVKPIRGGFAAITSNSESNTVNTSRLSTSYDGGKTWQPIDAGLQDKINSIGRNWDDRPRVQAFQTSIIKVGENFFCTHPDGIFRSSDKGKTWKLLLPSVKDKGFKGFNLFVSGNVIYAVRSKGGC
ncbi:MAG TPA: sialidase family protein, partial [Chitinophagaceae bacterium]